MEFKNVSQSSVFDKTQVDKVLWAEKAIDGDPYTFTRTGDGNHNYWEVVFHAERNISCFTIIAKKGSSLKKFFNYLFSLSEPKVQVNFSRTLSVCL